jgi:Capsular polysaccharide biosynthesis protein
VRRQIVNESEVLQAVQRFGFVTYALEELPLSAQIELFFDAEAVVAPHGAGLTNLLFADHVAVIELHPAQAVFPHYYFLCQAMGHPYRFVCADAALSQSDFMVDIDALNRALRELAG